MAKRRRTVAAPGETVEALCRARAATLQAAAGAMKQNAGVCARLALALDEEARQAAGRAGPLRLRASALRAASHAALSHNETFLREAARVLGEAEMARQRAQGKPSSPAAPSPREAVRRPGALRVRAAKRGRRRRPPPPAR